VRRVRAEPVEVLLGDDAALVDDEEAVGIGAVEEFGDGEQLVLAVPGREGDAGQVQLRRGSSQTGPSPRAIRAVGMSSRTCWNAHRLNGGRCQFASVTSRSGGNGGAPLMSAGPVAACPPPEITGTPVFPETRIPRTSG
jgi:hypothetical protein